MLGGSPLRMNPRCDVISQPHSHPITSHHFTSDQSGVSPAHLSLFLFFFFVVVVVLRRPITIRCLHLHLHHISSMIGWAVWDRELLIGQSAPGQPIRAERDRVEEVMLNMLVRVLVVFQRFVLFPDSELCSFHTAATRPWTATRPVPGCMGPDQY